MGKGRRTPRPTDRDITPRIAESFRKMSIFPRELRSPGHLGCLDGCTRRRSPWDAHCPNFHRRNRTRWSGVGRRLERPGLELPRTGRPVTPLHRPWAPDVGAGRNRDSSPAGPPGRALAFEARRWMRRPSPLAPLPGERTMGDRRLPNGPVILGPRPARRPHAPGRRWRSSACLPSTGSSRPWPRLRGRRGPRS